MNATGSRSLRRRLIARLLMFHIGSLFLFAIIFIAWLVHSDEGGVLVSPEFAEVAVRAIERAPDGSLHLRQTEELARLQHDTAGFWFVARSDKGEIVRSGEVPQIYRGLAANLDRMSFADIRDARKPYTYLAIIRRVSGQAGDFTILIKGNLFSPTFVVMFLSNLLMIPLLLVLAVVTLIATPLIVRREFAGLATVSTAAGRIDIERRGTRLPTDQVPAEVEPLVEAVNGALRRLDEGYERRQRFIIDAAHELRTPIAILQAKVEASADPDLARRFGTDIARLATLAEQLLDLQRIDRLALGTDTIDIADLARRVVADLAPLVIAAGGELEVVDLGGEGVRGDRPSLERVLANLVLNAFDHGGRRVIVRVAKATIDVEDDGPGIPSEERERVFEPFYRLRARQTGTGLGLNLVKQVMDRHGGSVVALDAPRGGTILRLEFTRCPDERRTDRLADGAGASDAL